MKTNKILKFCFFWIPFLILLTISLFVMYHAKFITDIYNSHFEKQLLWFGIGFLILFCFRYVPWKKLLKWSFVLYLINLFLLVLVLFLGSNINGSKAWLDFKIFRFQPSELMKFTLALTLAKICTQKKAQNWHEELTFFLKEAILVLLPSLLVFFEPDTGAILFYLLIALVFLWFSPIRKRWFWFFILLGISGLSGFFYCYFFQKDFLISLIGTSFFYRVERILSLGSGMQIENAKIALGSAPLFTFHLKETGIYIPEAPTDFVFALTSNVFGLTGNLLILICFLSIDLYLLTLVKKERRKSKKYFSYAFLSIFIGSQIINIAMNLGLFPIIGIPLPFISYGGSQTIVLFLFLSILFQKKKEKCRQNLH